MAIVVYSGQRRLWRHRAFGLTAALALGVAPGVAYAADPAKAACLADARRLCAAEMRALSRSKVRACLIARMTDTSPACHDYMVKARDAALAAHKPDQAGQ